jgi:hypothetical protein
MHRVKVSHFKARDSMKKLWNAWRSFQSDDLFTSGGDVAL